MARVRNHAAEYAALKARAQAVGLSTRAYRRARKAEPQKYYSPRAQKTLQRRANIVDAITSITRQRAPSSYSDAELKSSAEKRLKYSTPKQRDTLERTYQQYIVGVEGDIYWLDDDLYDDLGYLLYYRD